MRATVTSIPDIVRLEPEVFRDDRGFFLESFRADRAAANGIPGTFVQDNHSGSCKNTLRGLHYQIRHPQGKLIRIVTGEVFDVSVDLRRSSPYFGRWVGEVLSAENKRILWIPPGFAHGFLVLSDWADILYKATDYYAPEWERTLLWNDPTVGVDWPIPHGAKPLLSAKDAAGTPFGQSEVYE